MSAATVTPRPGAQETRPTEHAGVALLVSIAIYLTIWVFTRAHFMADTNVYTQAILNRHHGGGPADYRLLTSNPFWDFGHILWRPLGWLCFLIATPLTQLFAHQSEAAEVILALIGMSFLASLVCVFFFFHLARRVCGNNWTAVLATLGFFSADAFLNYAHSGAPYVAGLACLVAGMYFSLGQKEQVTSAGSALGAALMFALAVLFWFPYVFVLPAALASPLLIYGPDRQRVRRVGKTLVTCAVVGLAVYASTVAALGIRTVADLREWVVASSHGHIQPGGLRAMARLAFSMPRSFINMDRDGMWLKRYLIHDPYAPVTTRDLFRLSLWKLVVFYVSAGVVCIELLRSRRGLMLFMLLAASVLPIVVFALFIFEAGSIERYFPLYPFVFLACSYVLASEHARRASKLLLILTLTAAAAVNMNAMRTGTMDSRRAVVVARIHDLIPLLGPKSLVLAINEQDSLAQFRQNFPLDPINLQGEWQTYDMLEINTARLATWRSDLGERALANWRSGGDIWLPQRVFRSQPNPDWNWVEGDDPRVKWTDLPAFFSRFETGQIIGGEDGFKLWRDTPNNRQVLAEATGLTDKANEIRQGRSGAFTPAASACAPPTYGCARTDTAVIPLGTLPHWGGLTGANTVFVDNNFNPTYPPKYVRVTDGNSADGRGEKYSSFAVGSGSGDDSHFNADDTLFWITDSGNDLYVYGLNPDTMSTGLVWWPSNLLGAASFSQTSRGYMYEIAYGLIHRYDLSSCTVGSCRPPVPKLIYNFVANCNVNPNIEFTANAGIGGGDTVFGATYAATEQDYGHQVVAYDTSSNTCYFYNTQYGTVRSYVGTHTPLRGTVGCNGTRTITWNSGSPFDTNWRGINFSIGKLTSVVTDVASTTALTIRSSCPAGNRLAYSTDPGILIGTVTSPDRYSVHSAAVDPSGQWMIVDEGASCTSGRCAVVHAWKIGTTTVKSCIYSCGSHYTTTATGWFNSIQKDDDPSPPPNPLLYRTWTNFDSSNANDLTYLSNTSSDVADYAPFENHPSAKNDPLGTHTYPIFTSTFAPESPRGTISRWVSNEVIAWPQGKPGPVMRFGHTFNSALEPTACCFTAEYAIGAISSTGRFYIFTTDGEGTLGSTTGGAACSISAGTCRGDVFILNLAPPPAK